MPDQRTNHQRTHSLLLLQRLLSLKSGTSPFTLLLDTTEQSSRPVIQEFITRAKTSKTTIIYISYETLLPPKNTTSFIRANKLTLSQLQSEISSKIPSPAATSITTTPPPSATLLILDTIHPILPLCTPTQSLSSFLTSLLPSPQTSLLATYHTSIPLAPSVLQGISVYNPSPLQLLSYLATTVVHVESLHHVLAEQRARERAEAVPIFGLDQGVEGVVLGKGANVSAMRASAARTSELMGGKPEGLGSVVLRIEHRRKSGRGVGVDAVLTLGCDGEQGNKGITLLDEHPLYAPKREAIDADKDDGLESTFNLNLTAKQRLDREGVVLPYFDAQSSNGPGEGGRIIYQMGNEDLGDWDEEEDEI